MQKYSQLIIGLLLGLLVGIFCGKMMFSNHQNDTSIANSNSNNSVSEKTKTTNKSSENNYSENEEIPEKVYKVLKYIQENHQAPDGYVGGREFKNRENQLPKETNLHQKIKYQEWDVNPKLEGRNRGTERLVTGDDDRNWYTNNHYKTFTQLKNK